MIRVMPRVGAHIPDEALIRVAHPASVASFQNDGKRTYRAVYKDGTIIGLAVPSAEHARTYAVEYGVRFVGSALLSVAWDRPSGSAATVKPSRRGGTMADTRKRLSDEEKAQAVAETKALIDASGGKNESAAFAQIADKFGVSAQTIRTRYKETYPGKARGSASKAPKSSGEVSVAEARDTIRLAWKSFDSIKRHKEHLITKAQAEADKEIARLREDIKALEDERAGLKAAGKALGLDLD